MVGIGASTQNFHNFIQTLVSLEGGLYSAVHGRLPADDVNDD